VDYFTWRDLVAAYTLVTAAALGWRLHQVKRAERTRSMYLTFKAAGRKAVVRLSDHRPRPGSGRRESMLSISRPETQRVGLLAAFFAERCPFTP
jgi:hypothetical protein